MADLVEILQRTIDAQAQLLMRVAEVERKMDNQVRHGKVTDVDTKKQLARIEIGERDGKPLKSAWVPYGQIAGDYKSHRPPTKGQQMTMYAPNGEGRQAILMPMTWSDNNKSPSEKEDEHVTTYGDKYRLREKKNELRSFTLDKTKQAFTKDKITTSINGGNTPGDNNGPKADDGTNDQEASGSSIVQEEKKITIKTPGVSIVHDENEYTITASERITLKVGGAAVTIEPELIAAIAAIVKAGPRVKLGVASKDADAIPKVITEAGPSEKVRANI